jgi:putative addiction module killer protein
VIHVRQYIDELGRNGFERWFERLDASVQARVTAYLDRLGRGSFSAIKGVGAIFELRLDFGPGYRVYFGKDGETLVILLAGGTKRRQRDDIAHAQTLWQEYKRRKKGK